MENGSESAAQAAPGNARGHGRLIYRQSAWTRVTHWVWAVACFSCCSRAADLQRPSRALSRRPSGFGFDNDVLAIGAENSRDGPRRLHRFSARRFDTTGVLGMSGPADGRARGFPAWATIPSYHDLATGRVVHFFFAWILVGTLVVWLVASLVNGHLRRDLAAARADLTRLPRDIADHVRLSSTTRATTTRCRNSPMPACSSCCFPLMIADRARDVAER